MTRVSENRIVLITRRTRLAGLIEKFNTLEQARFYIEHLGADFSVYVREDTCYRSAAGLCSRAIEQLGRLHTIDRSFLPNYLFGPDDTVVVLGQDGLVANTVKYLDGQPVIGVNPDPVNWDGVLLPFTPDRVGDAVNSVFAGTHATQAVTMAQARLQDGQTLLAVNDLFIGPKSHESARYRIRHGREIEDQSSSGVIVSTGLGSTGWLKSLVAGAYGILKGQSAEEIPAFLDPRFPWDSRELRFTVREPFPSVSSAAKLVQGTVTPATPLVIESRMAGNGVIFSDGIEKDFLEFQSGSIATIGLAEKTGCLVLS